MKRGRLRLRGQMVTLRADGDTSAIGSGLNVGEQVVIEGQLKLKSGAAVSIGGAKTPEPGAAGDGTVKKKKSTP